MTNSEQNEPRILGSVAGREIVISGECVIEPGDSEAQVVIDIPDGWEYELDDGERMAGRLYVNMWDPAKVEEEEDDAN